MNQFLLGMMTFASGAAGLFFLTFWTRTRDRLFLLFAISFWLLALTRALPCLLPNTDDHDPSIYCLRCASFLLIALAVLGKNKRARR